MKLRMALKDNLQLEFKDLIQWRQDDEDSLVPFLHVVYRTKRGTISQASVKIDDIIYYEVELDEESSKRTEEEIKRQEMMKEAKDMEGGSVVSFKH